MLPGKKLLRDSLLFLKYSRHYLLGRRFLVRTDHAALQWLRRIPDPVGQQARWIGYMEEFDFNIAYRCGSRHINADAMSRLPCRRRDCYFAVKITQNSGETNRRASVFALQSRKLVSRTPSDSSSLSRYTR